MAEHEILEAVAPLWEADETHVVDRYRPPSESIIMNITGKKGEDPIDPFIPIEKRPLNDGQGNFAHAYGIYLGEGDESVHVGNVSDRYLVVPNREARDAMLDIATNSGLQFEETRLFWDGKRMLHVIEFPGTNVPIDPEDAGDTIGLALVMRNSYDTSWRFKAGLMGMRQICSNGILSGEFFAEYSFPHVDENANWQESLAEALAMIQTEGSSNAGSLLAALRGMKQVSASVFIDQIPDILPGVGDAALGAIMRRWSRENDATMFGLFNAVTAHYWHGKAFTAAGVKNMERVVTVMMRYGLSFTS